MIERQYGYNYAIRTRDNKTKISSIAATRESKAKQILKTRFPSCTIISLERTQFSYPFEVRERY